MPREIRLFEKGRCLLMSCPGLGAQGSIFGASGVVIVIRREWGERKRKGQRQRKWLGLKTMLTVHALVKRSFLFVLAQEIQNDIAVPYSWW